MLSSSVVPVVFLIALSSMLSCGSGSKLARTDTLTPLQQLQAEIGAVLQDSVLSQSSTGIEIVSLDSGTVLYERGSQLLFNPASNMKLLTTAAALKFLGPDFRFRTELHADTASVGDTVIHGNLYLKGYADPSLTSANLWALVQKLKAKKIRRIDGDLICDETYLDDTYFGSGWMWDDASSRSYAPISGLSVNRNTIAIEVAPGDSVGDSLRVSMEPATGYLHVENYGATVDSSDSNSVREFEVARKWREHENTVLIKGGMTPRTKPVTLVTEVLGPALYAGTLLAELLPENGISFAGRVISGVLPDTTTRLATHYSEPLAGLLATINKASDNHYAEMILETLGAEMVSTPGSGHKGLHLVKRLLHDAGVDTLAIRLADGSGVSRYNIISPHQMVKLLQFMHRDFTTQAEFKASLAIAGIDGTLDNRMKGTAAEGKLRGKTGTLSGASALSGYTTSADGEQLAFSIMTQHFVSRASMIRAIQDRIGYLLSSFSRR